MKNQGTEKRHRKLPRLIKTGLCLASLETLPVWETCILGESFSGPETAQGLNPDLSSFDFIITECINHTLLSGLASRVCPGEDEVVAFHRWHQARALRRATLSSPPEALRGKVLPHPKENSAHFSGKGK